MGALDKFDANQVQVRILKGKVILIDWRLKRQQRKTEKSIATPRACGVEAGNYAALSIICTIVVSLKQSRSFPSVKRISLNSFLNSETVQKTTTFRKEIQCIQN